MARRGIRIKRLEEPEVYFVLVDEGEGLNHLYTFNVTKCESGTLYDMYNSKTGDHLLDYRNKPIYSLLNNGNGYVFVDFDPPMKRYEYDEFYKHTLLFNFIQKLESDSSPNFYYEIHKSVIIHQGKL